VFKAVTVCVIVADFDVNCCNWFGRNWEFSTRMNALKIRLCLTASSKTVSLYLWMHTFNYQNLTDWWLITVEFCSCSVADDMQLPSTGCCRHWRLVVRLWCTLTWQTVGVGGTVQSPIWYDLCHFRVGLHSQSLDWYWQTKQYTKVHKLNTTQNTAKQNYPGSVASKLQCSARKRDGLILQCFWAHTGQAIS